jgi:hypothetical protein
MFAKIPNFSGFHEDKQNVPDLLIQKSSLQAQKHPEFGILPYNAQCSTCVELIDKRTVDSRFFIDPNDAGHTWSQKSYFPLHYKKSADDVWHTIDKRLRPDANNPGVYVAANQPVPTKYDVNKKSASIITDGLELEFNKNLTLYFFDENVAYTNPEAASYADYTIGEEGVQVKNIWTGINMSAQFSTGSVKTSYVITAPLQLPINSGWMVIEDHLTLPEGVTVAEAPNGKHLENGNYGGDYIFKNVAGDTVFIYQRPIYLDARAFGMHGSYKLIQKGRNCTLQMLVPVSWLKSTDNQYPICIDPFIKGVSKLGNFNSSGNASGNLGFTSMNLGSCDFTIPVTVPGNSQLTNAYVDLEYFLTFDNTCGSPPEPAPYCTFSQVRQTLINNTCNTSTGVLSCNQGQGFISGQGIYSRYCTTDSLGVPGAHAILINNFAPDFLSCSAPQCANYNLNFTLENQDSICGDACGYLCANGSLWQMTVEACSGPPAISPDSVIVAPGQTATFNVLSACGPKPSEFKWTQDGNTTDNTTGSFTKTEFHYDSVICVTVGCMGIEDTLTGYVFVTGPAIADPGRDTFVCNGGVLILGGNLTPNPGDTIKWTSADSAAQSWLSNRTIYHPVLTIPAGVTGTFTFTLTVSDSLVSDSSVTISSYPAPTVTFTDDTITLCSNAPGPDISLAGGSPTGGRYSGFLVYNGILYGDSVGAAHGLYPAEPDTVFYTYTDTDGCSVTAFDTVKLVICSGIPALTSNNTIELYPNPATGKLVVITSMLHAATITIYDMDGRKVWQQNFAPEIDISTLAPGVYTVEITGAEGSVRKRLEKI